MSVDRIDLNVALGSFVAGYGISEEVFDSWADYESWLDDLTHHVANQIDSAGNSRFEVFDHVTGVTVSKPYADRESASQICRSFNTPASGGRYGVRRV